jgi:hypothetical protein
MKPTTPSSGGLVMPGVPPRLLVALVDGMHLDGLECRVNTRGVFLHCHIFSQHS